MLFCCFSSKVFSCDPHSSNRNNKLRRNNGDPSDSVSKDFPPNYTSVLSHCRPLAFSQRSLRFSYSRIVVLTCILLKVLKVARFQYLYWGDLYFTVVSDTMGKQLSPASLGLSLRRGFKWVHATNRGGVKG